MTNFHEKLFQKNFNYENLKNSIKVMELIFALFALSKNKKIINLPLKRKYHKTNINFMNIAILFGRKNSKSIKNKNILKIF